MRTDVVVVGGGTAGNVVAARLVEAGASVVVCEAGPDYGALDEGRWPSELLDATTLPTSHDWGFTGESADGRTLEFDRAKVIGGCSSHNGSTMSIGWSGDYASLPPGWSVDALRPAVDRAIERTRVHVPGEDDIQPFQRAFLDACASLGVMRTDDLLDPKGGVGVSLSPVNVVDGKRWNTAIAYLDPVRQSSGLRVIDRCLVDRVECVGGRVVGVHTLVDGRPLRIGTDLVVLAAGTYGTPAILLRSGLGPASDLRSVGVDVVVDLAGVGRLVQDQPVLRLEFASTALLDRELAAFAAWRGFLPEEQTVAKLASSTANAPFDTHVFPWIEPAEEGTWRCVVPIGLLRPDSFGSVRLADSDPTSAPVIDHRYLSTASDVERLVEFVPWVRELVHTDALRGYVGPAQRFPEDEPQRWAMRHHVHYWHPTGGAGLGDPDDEFTVCDARARVLGVEGLVVADASLFPRVPRATTALPVTAIGEHVATKLTG